MVWGVGCRVHGVEGLRFRVWGSGSMVQAAMK